MTVNTTLLIVNTMAMNYQLEVRLAQVTLYDNSLQITVYCGRLHMTDQ